MAALLMLLVALCGKTLSAAASSSVDDHALLRGLQSAACTDCVVNGVGYCFGDSYPNPSCLPNTCSCAEGDPAMVPCTMMACERDCDGLAVCEHDGGYYCEGDQFYDTTCMPNTCRCDSNGGVACTKMACGAQCETDDDCEAAVRTNSSQPELYRQCACEARSTNDYIAARFNECLGDERDGYECTRDDSCGDTCAGLRAVCSAENKCILGPDDQVACAADVFDCGNDGVYVPRDPNNNCAFKPCPTCENNGITFSAGQSFVDGCNSCECTEQGPICTLAECNCTACEDEYCVGEVFLAQDGCNTCTCGSEDGLVMCTAMACPAATVADTNTTTQPDEPPTLPIECDGCVHNGICYSVGEDYFDGCNTCACSGPDNLAICTLKACPECTTCEGQYCVGEVFLADDGCNTCTCGSEDGLATCTMMACPEPTTCENNGIVYSIGQSFIDGCNSCECTEQGPICTLAECNCTACEGQYCVGEVFVAEDGCNACTCGSEDGIVMCTMMACPIKTEQGGPEIIQTLETGGSTSGEGEAPSSGSGTIFDSGYAVLLLLSSVSTVAIGFV